MHSALKQDPSWRNEIGKLEDTVGEWGFGGQVLQIVI
jgi:hypothetical protein